MPIYKTKNEDFFKKWSSEMAYVLGFFTADGNMTKHKNGGCYIEFTSNDYEVLYKIKKIIGLDNKISWRNRNSKIHYRIQMGSKVLYEDLISLGLTPNKSLTIKFPNISLVHLKHFIRGYFDGDGCVYFKQNWAKDRGKFRWVFQVRFTSGSKQFLEVFHSLLKDLKICKGGYLYHKNRGYELVFSHYDGLALFRFLYDNVSAEMYLERKYDIFQRAFKVLHLGT